MSYPIVVYFRKLMWNIWSSYYYINNKWTGGNKCWTVIQKDFILICFYSYIVRFYYVNYHSYGINWFD